MDLKVHWETVYRTKQPHEVSWFQREAALSLTLIRRVASAPTARIIDVGAGAATLVDRLVADGYRKVTVLDVSSSALELARQRLGDAADAVTWIEADVLSADLPPAAFDLWHDRAVFHFLTSADDRSRYIEQVRKSVKPGGYLLVATFAEDGPTRCSGLPTARYSAAALQHEFGAAFRLVESVREEHVTPSGATQAFVYCLCQIESVPQNAAVAGDRKTTIAPFLSVRRGANAIDFYKKAFQAEELFRIENEQGEVVARLSVQGAEFWIADESPAHLNFSPESLGGGTARFLLTVGDPDVAFERAVSAGATVVSPVGNQHGWRLGRVVDPFGHHWEIAKPISDGQ